MGRYFSDEELGAQIGQRLREVRGSDSRSKVQELTGLHPNTLANYENGRLPDVGFVTRFCKVYGINEQWLLTGVGAKKSVDCYVGDHVSVKVHDLSASSGRSLCLPHGRAEQSIFLPHHFLEETGLERDRLLAIYNHGTANLPDISDGDVLVVDTSCALENDGFYVIVAGNMLLCRMVERKIDGGVCTRLLNGSDVRLLSRDEAATLNIFGRVIWRLGTV